MRSVAPYRMPVLDYSASRAFEIKNTGTVPLTFALSTNTNVMEGTPVVVEPGARRTRVTPNLNNDGTAKILYAQNTDTAVQGAYKVWVDE